MLFSSLLLALPVVTRYIKYFALALPFKLYYSDFKVNAHAQSSPVGLRIVTLWNRLQAATVLSGSLITLTHSLLRLTN